jgi:hypothetical protein
MTNSVAPVSAHANTPSLKPQATPPTSRNHKFCPKEFTPEQQRGVNTQDKNINSTPNFRISPLQASHKRRSRKLILAMNTVGGSSQFDLYCEISYTSNPPNTFRRWNENCTYEIFHFLSSIYIFFVVPRISNFKLDKIFGAFLHENDLIIK